jgi:UTP--glucose-1-phosphate uridylyltransferase
MKKVRKAIIPAAGFGTRFLPATKAMPKEMLPVVDKPIIQYVVEDAVAAGIEDVIIVTGWSKRSIEDHFDYPFELEKKLEESGKEKELEEIRRISNLANFFYVRQKGPYGNATPILNARSIVGDEPFLVLWGDEFIEATPGASQQLVNAYETHGGSMVLGSVKKNSPEDYKRYGYATGTEMDSGFMKIEKIIEKPGVGTIQSDYAMISPFLFEPDFFDAIEEALGRHKNDGREIHYIDAINIMLEQKKTCYGLQFAESKYHDCGNKLEYLKTVVEFGLKHEDLHKEFGEYLKNLKV